ncbi:hypothetical protein E2C01_034914 [Portunus trituberculatus]|uniref:Uncharacterized protein n=1 Tax=Portunus trituberculatus TaxID=210409 RepID=A0A5B7F706_PORTR|nr:hypothetical protein [Portunus trituberculatus]
MTSGEAMCGWWRVGSGRGGVGAVGGARVRWAGVRLCWSKYISGQELIQRTEESRRHALLWIARTTATAAATATHLESHSDAGHEHELLAQRRCLQRSSATLRDFPGSMRGSVAALATVLGLLLANARSALLVTANVATNEILDAPVQRVLKAKLAGMATPRGVLVNPRGCLVRSDLQ